jgi:hypothetical protein
MKLAAFSRAALVLLLLLLESGCTTSRLWKRTDLCAFNEPADDPHLRLFDFGKQDDLLVVYNEYSERSDSVRPRAYLLKENQKRIDLNRRPRFVSANLTGGLKPIPTFSFTNAEPSSPDQICFDLSADRKSFSLYSAGQEISYDLPVYKDRVGTTVRAGLTPVAVAADLTIVGGIVGYYVLQGIAVSGTTYSWQGF